MSEPADFRILFESAPGLCLALLPDSPRHTIVAVSDDYARATMRQREDIVGRGLFEVMPDDPAGSQAGGMRGLRDSLDRVAALGAIDAMAVQRREVPRPAEQGGGFEERWWRPVNSPVLDRSGRLAYLIHRVDDVTDLMRRVTERTEQLCRLSADLDAAEERERRQIARDLHDDLSQVLAAARIRLSVLCGDGREDVRRAALGIAALVDRADRSTRSLATQLAPALLYELGLTPALERLAEEMSASFGLRVDIVDDGLPKPLSQEAHSIAYRAVRELLINVAKHARVRSTRLQLGREDGQLVVRVSDDGVGFRADDRAQERRGLGLVSLTERLSFVGGSFGIRSVPGDGTEATLRLPLDPGQSR